VNEAIRLLRSKRQPDGTRLLETHPGKVHFALEDRDHRPSRWNTQRALRVSAGTSSDNEDCGSLPGLSRIAATLINHHAAPGYGTIILGSPTEDGQRGFLQANVYS
jgi:hypothetical protein